MSHFTPAYNVTKPGFFFKRHKALIKWIITTEYCQTVNCGKKKLGKGGRIKKLGTKLSVRNFDYKCVGEKGEQ